MPIVELENVLRQAVKKWSSAFYFKIYGTTNDRFQGGKLPNVNCDFIFKALHVK